MGGPVLTVAPGMTKRSISCSVSLACARPVEDRGPLRRRWLTLFPSLDRSSYFPAQNWVFSRLWPLTRAKQDPPGVAGGC
jgi:hypothetical protein